MASQTADHQLNQTTILERRLASANNKAVVVGLYGVPGCGKTHLLSQLKQELGLENFEYYDGSKMINDLVPGGLDAFKKLEELKQEDWRKLVIHTIGKECTESGKVGVVAGHFMFWPSEEKSGQPVYTTNDLVTYTHILYLDVDARTVAQRRLLDSKRSRPNVSIAHLEEWQKAEKTQLRDLCHRHKILFSTVSGYPSQVSALIRNFRLHNERYNLTLAGNRLDEALVASGQGQLGTILVIDADKTLAANDTGAMFWGKVPSSRRPGDELEPLQTLFSSRLGYSYNAFRQATLLYEKAADDQEFDSICQDVASEVTMYPEFASLLTLVAKKEHVGAVIVTCGLRRVWEKVLEKTGLSKTVKVIGGGRIADGFVVTAVVKAALVARLQHTHQLYVWAFGDSPLDLGMLKLADQAIVVVGEEPTRSKSMDAALQKAIDNSGLRVRQALLPSTASPRLNTTILPLIQLTEPEFINSVLHRRSRNVSIPILHASDRNAAKLLMTPMRNASNAGPALREAHHRVGWYLATEYLADVIGLEDYLIPHVQGNDTDGYRLQKEKQTSIVALMRGGEPMALGVNDAVPLAMFIHAHRPDDLTLLQLEGQRTVVLVDSVVNSGKTIVEFAQHIRKLDVSIRIVVITGVAQTQAISPFGEGTLAQELSARGIDKNIGVIALRISENKFTGIKNTDTGNRLFNTTHLD